MPHYNLALFGFGNVGQAFARLLLQKREDLSQRYQINFAITCISTGRHGTAIDPSGLDIQAVLDQVKAGKSLDVLKKLPKEHRLPVTAAELLRESQADVLFESIPVNYQTGQPALSYLRTALEMGIHAITANKGPVVHAHQDLTSLAQKIGVKFFFESTVMDGAPIFSLFRSALPGARLLGFRGILNSTTNLILTRMESGDTFDQAVKYAQSIGIAETDPSGDVDGWDAAIKVAILVSVLMGIPTTADKVDRQGIRQITTADIEQAKQQGKRWKLICSAGYHDGQLTTRVAPEMVSADSPFYGVQGTSSIIQFKTDTLESLALIENNPGPNTTAYGFLADFINAVTH